MELPKDGSEVKLDGTTIEDAEKGGQKQPRKIIYFQDGDVLEEYSTDEEAEDEPDQLDIAVKNLDSLNWNSMGWAAYIANLGLFGFLRTIKSFEHAGEIISYKLGITAPKYQSEIDEAQRLEEEEEIEKKSQLEEVSWNKTKDHGADPRTPDRGNVMSPPRGMIMSPPRATSTPYH